MTRTVVRATVVLTLVTLTHGPVARAQGLSAEASVGRLVYDAASANVGTNHLMLGLRYDTRKDTWVYGAGAVPPTEAGTFWAATGTGGRLLLPTGLASRVRLGADAGVHGFWFRDRVSDLAGTGGTLEAIPFLRVNAGEGYVEGRAGWRGHTSSFGGLRMNRGVFETGARGGFGDRVRVEGDLRWVRATEGTYPFMGATAAYGTSRADVWGYVGRWLAADLDRPVWAVGSTVSLGPRTHLWGSVRQEAPDPLYWNPSRRTWTVGMTQRLSRLPTRAMPLAQFPAGTVVVQLRVSDAPAGIVSIAGDFNQWQATPMLREGGVWIIRLPLASGVYHYAFKSAAGKWFVPPSTPGRRADGMGGFVATLVVS